ncbi:LOW QUALITY PROTEIN: hypothetical protein YC2023_076834 [Brassica napus]
MKGKKDNINERSSDEEDVKIPMVFDSFMEINVSQQKISDSNMVDDTIVLTQEVHHSSSVHVPPSIFFPIGKDRKFLMNYRYLVFSRISLQEELHSPSFTDAKSTPCPKLACSSSVRTILQVMEDVPSNIIMNEGIVLSVNDPSNMTSFTSEYI